MSLGVTRKLCKFVDELKFEDIPSSVVKEMKLAILDTIGCIILGSKTDAGKIIIDFAKDRGRVEESSIIATNIKSSSEYAALANGTMGHEFDYDDGVLGNIHAGIQMVPAAIAIGEKEQRTGKEVITALTAGYEVGCRIGGALEQIPHTSVSMGAFGATAVACRLLHLGLEDIVNAFGICGSLIPTHSFEPAVSGAMVKEMWGGWPNFFGIQCAMLAQRGFTGQPDVLEAKQGLYRAISGGKFDEKVLLEGLGKKFMWVEGHYLKPYSACRGTHVALDAASKLLKKGKINLEDVDEIFLFALPFTCGLKGAFKPVSARFSIPFLISALFVEGSIGVDTFEEKKFKDPKILKLSEKIHSYVDPTIPLWPHAHGPVRIMVKFKDGTTRSASSNEERTLTEIEAKEKFKYNASKVFTEKQALKIINEVDKLEDSKNITSLTTLLMKTVI